MPLTTIRLLDPDTDFPRLVELYDSARADPVTVEILREREARTPQQRVRRRVVAIDEHGYIAGFGDAGRDDWLLPGRFWIHVIVDPALRRRGIGMQLYRDVLQFATDAGASELEAGVRDNCSPCLHFAERHGFAVERHTFDSTLDLATFDEARFTGTIAAVEEAGIRFFSLADVGNTPEAQRKLYELNRRTAMDNPGNDEEFEPFEEFAKFVFGSSWFRADGQILAADGDHYIGLAATGISSATGTAFNAFTGVDRAYRGRNIALALKLLAIRCARSYGVSSIRTNNDSQNAPMLAINRKLGYRPEPGSFRLARRLVPA